MKRIKLTANEGMWLTDGDICAKSVYLGENDEPGNWREITEEERERIIKEADAVDK